jgi:hypothetical protein
MTQAAGGNVLRADENAAFLDQAIVSISSEPCATPKPLLDAGGQSRFISIQSGEVQVDGQKSIVKGHENSLEEKIPKQAMQVTVEEKENFLKHQFLPVQQPDTESELFLEILDTEESQDEEVSEAKAIKRESIDLEEESLTNLSSETVDDVDDLAAAFFAFAGAASDADDVVAAESYVKETAGKEEVRAEEEELVAEEKKELSVEKKELSVEKKEVGEKEDVVSGQLKVSATSAFNKANLSASTAGIAIKNANGTISFKSLSGMNNKEQAEAHKQGLSCVDKSAKKLFVAEGSEHSTSKTVTFSDVDENGKVYEYTLDVEVLSKHEFELLSNFAAEYINEQAESEKTETRPISVAHEYAKSKDLQQTFTLFFAERQVTDQTHKSFSKLTQQRESESAKLTKQEEQAHQLENERKKQELAIDKARNIVKVQEERRDIIKEQVTHDEHKREIQVLESRHVAANPKAK